MIEDASAADSPHAAEQDENYFVSMTDMMVGILFIFIILLMVFALNFRTQTDVSDERLRQLEEAARQAEAVAQQLEDLQAQVQNEIASIDASARVRSEMLEEIRRQLEAAGVQVEIDEANGVLRLTEAAIRFGLESSELSSEARENVARVAEVLSRVLPDYTAGGLAPSHVETVFVEGHTDKTGRDERNWQLSTERAVNTYALMTELFPTLRQIRNDEGKEVLSVSGYSSTRPIPGQPVTNYDVQRRIDLRFVMEVDDRRRLVRLRDLTMAMESELEVLRQAVEDARGN